MTRLLVWARAAALCYVSTLVLGQVEALKHVPYTWAPFGAGGASGATGYLSGDERWSASVLADRQRGRRDESGEGAWDLPDSYYLDESDPDILVLRRHDGTFVAAFSAQGASREGIVEAAKEDYQALLLARLAREGRRGSGEGEGPDPTSAPG